jgi:hypothetical protein
VGEYRRISCLPPRFGTPDVNRLLLPISLSKAPLTWTQERVCLLAKPSNEGQGGLAGIRGNSVRPRKGSRPGGTGTSSYANPVSREARLPANSLSSRPPDNSRSANRLTASGIPSFLFVSTQLRKRITELLQRTRIRNYISSSMANKEPMEDPGRQ